jgi:alkanesulfonate monooxygenase SsuD/methylene tetrahydromethanopterin reductase-like flavin-dependent oxidoreductase (luciferase family)
MKVGIGLPNTVPGASGKQIVDWARRAEKRGFSSLGTLDRIVYPNYEALTTLAAAAAVTERVELLTGVLLGPLRRNVSLFAKQAASLSALSDGRFTLGIALGAREDDYEVSGVDLQGRGERLDSILEQAREIWAGDEIGPDATPRVVIGGHADASFERAARFGEGWIAGGLPPDQYAGMLEKLGAAWSDAGRDGEPRRMSLAYFSLGDRAEATAESYLKHYYAWLGETADQIAASAATDADTVAQYVSAYEAAGCDELVLFPCSTDPEQVDLLADAVGR